GPVELWATPSPCPYRRIPSPHSRPGPEWKTVFAPRRVSPAAHSAGRREWKNRRIPTGYPRPLWSTRQLRADRVGAGPELLVARQFLLDLLDRVDHRRMVAAAEQPADLDEREAEELAHQVHGDLARDREILGAPLGAERLDRHAPRLGHAGADQVRRQLGSRVGGEHPAEGLARQLDGDLPPRQR